MTGVVSITLPFPPSVNRMWRTWKGRMLLSRQGREYRTEALRALAGVDSFGRKHVRVHVRMFVPDGRRRDIDNLWKAAGDALQAGRVVHDDSQIRDLRLQHCGTDREWPRIEVTITGIT